MDGRQTILAIEASAGVASVAVMAGGAILGEMRDDRGANYGARLLPLARDCLGHAGVDIGDVGCVLAGRGPGSFTGVRVALAAAKGLMLAGGVKACGIGSLAALGQHAAHEREVDIAVVADTRRAGLVYLQMVNADGTAVGEAEILGHDGAAEMIKARGIGAVIGNAEIPGLDITPAEPLATHLCHAYMMDSTADMPLEPLYLGEALTGPPPRAARK